MRPILPIAVAALLAAWQPALAVEGVSSRDLVPDSVAAPPAREPQAPPLPASREIKGSQAQEPARKGKTQADTAGVGDVIVTGKSKDITTLSGSKGSESEANVGSIKVAK